MVILGDNGYMVHPCDLIDTLYIPIAYADTSRIGRSDRGYKKKPEIQPGKHEDQRREPKRIVNEPDEAQFIPKILFEVWSKFSGGFPVYHLNQFLNLMQS